MAPDPYIRFRNPDDMGLRPPDASMYSTPAISILKPPNMGLDPDPAVAYADVDQFVHVEVSNKGNQVANAFVTVWAGGFGTSSGYAASLGGINGTTAPVTIPAGSSGSQTFVNIDWRPQAAEIGGPQRHFCVQANVFIDSNDQEPDPNAPAGTAPAIDILGNIRHAQRNMTLLPKPTMLRDPIEFEMAMGNPDEEPGEFRFEVREVRGKFQRNEIAHLRETRWIDPGIERGLVLPDSKGEVELRPSRERPRDFEIELGKKSGKKVKAKLKPGEQGTMTLRMELQPGEEAAVHRFDVLQHGRKGLVGAARVMTIAVPEALLERDYEYRAS